MPQLIANEGLVVDDNYTARLTMAWMLRSLGLRITEASCGNDAIAIARRAQAEGRAFAVALVDWRMPDIDGFDLVDTLRDFDAMAKTSFIMVSAYPWAEVKIEADRAAWGWSLAGVLQKPVALPALLEVLPMAVS